MLQRSVVGLFVALAFVAVANTASAKPKKGTPPPQPPEPPAPSAAVDDDSCPPGTTLHRTRAERYCFKPSYAKEGRWVFWYDNGQKKADTDYLNGKRHGKRTFWFESGQVKEESTWKDNDLDGKQTFFYKNGKKEKEIEYKAGKEHGAMQSWDDKGGKREGKTVYWFPAKDGGQGGQKKEEIDYKAGKTDGSHVWYWENGKKKVDTRFLNGRKTGLSSEWSMQGSFLQATCYRDTEERWRTDDEAASKSRPCN